MSTPFLKPISKMTFSFIELPWYLSRWCRNQRHCWCDVNWIAFVWCRRRPLSYRNSKSKICLKEEHIDWKEIRAIRSFRGTTPATSKLATPMNYCRIISMIEGKGVQLFINRSLSISTFLLKKFNTKNFSTPNCRYFAKKLVSF